MPEDNLGLSASPDIVPPANEDESSGLSGGTAYIHHQDLDMVRIDHN